MGSYAGISNHFNILTQKCRKDILQNMAEDAVLILEYAVAKRIITDIPLEAENKAVSMISMIFQALSEKEDKLFPKYDITPISFPNWPHPTIAVCNPLLDDPVGFKTYKLIVDGVEITEAYDAASATFLLLASYFNFNRPYPDEVACFLSFVQMRYLNIQDPEGATRSSSLKFAKRAFTYYNQLENAKPKLLK